jgi:uncharacterized protein (DUF486 family)
MKAFYSIGLLILSNIFMTLAWYGHLKFSDSKKLSGLGLFSIILISWGIAFFEYCMQVPANKIGYKGQGGPFTLLELKVIQEVIALLVFLLFSFIFFKNETLKWNHTVGLVFLVLSVYFIFRK